MAAVVVLASAAVLLAQDGGRQDPVAAEVDRLLAFLAKADAKDAYLGQVKGGAEPELQKARAALQQGRPLAALYRLARVRANVVGYAFLADKSVGGEPDQALLDREWERVGRELGAAVDAPAADAGAAIGNAALRALFEASAPQVRGYYTASRDFGRATNASTGLFYLGSALGEREFAAMLRAQAVPADGKPLSLRSLAPEIDALGRDMVAAYAPPLSIDRSMEFDVAHAALAEARTLDAAGLRHGALLRYVQAAFRFLPLRGPVPSRPRAELAQALAAARARCADDGRDHAIARMLIEVAESELQAQGADAAPPAAQWIVAEGLPRYFAALAPAPAAPPAVAPVATVTLVRWPYT